MPDPLRAVPTTRPPMAGLGLISLAVLALQVSLTRVFSLLIWYHFAFLAIAMALLGFTAGGLAVQLRPALREGDVAGRAARLSFGVAGCTVLALLLAAHLPFARSVLADARQFGCFLALVASFLVPFFLAGVVVSATLAAHGAAVSRLYFANLLGSGLGCGASVLALDHLGGGAGAVLFAALAAVLAGLCFARHAALHRRRVAVTGVALGAALVGLLALARDPLREPFYLPNAKLYPRVARAMILARRCTSVACVDLFVNPYHLGVWAVSALYRGPFPDQIGVVIDAWALTSIFRADAGPDGRPELRHPIFEALPPSLVHQLDRSRRRRADRMLVIGAGGGVDVRAAVHFGVRRIEAVDINPTILDAVRRDFDRFAGGLYRHPSVRVAHAEGRHYLRRSQRRYDVIQISGVDTYAASQAGAFALSENYLYTVEAFREYLEHLAPGGTLTLTRWLYTPPRQTLRLCVIADEALRALGTDGAARRIVVVAAPVPAAEIHFSVVLVRREPFPDAELRALRRLAESSGFGVVYSPDGLSPRSPFTDYFAARDRGAYVRAYPFRIEANTDDTPFFFEHNRFARLLESREAIFGAASGQMLLVVTLLLVLACAGIFLVLPARRARFANPMRAVDQAFFAALGAGYIALEMVFVPRFTLYLGNPLYALSVVLFALLCASGVGAALAPRLAGRSRRRLALVAVAVAIVVVAYQLGLQRLFEATLRLPFEARVAVAIALIAVPGMLMGVAFPAALARAPVGAARGGWIARAWVLNGYASVATSVAAMILAIAEGLSAVLLAGAGCYLLAAALALRAEVPARPSTPLE